MVKVPRLCVQWIVNLAKKPSTSAGTVVIYIGSDIVTLGYRSVSGGSRQAKKRLGSRSDTSSLTQSLTLSHIHRILARQNSSAPIAIILPNSLFTRVTISVPTDLAPQDLGPTLSWALQQQGFAPSDDWLWDATLITSGHGQSADYDVLLIETAAIDRFLQRLGVPQKRLRLLIPETPVANQATVDVCGPWLSVHQVEQVLSVLNSVTSQQQPPLNLMHNLVMHITTRYQQAFYQCAMVTCVLLLMTGTWWWQSSHAPLLAPTNSAEPAPTPIPPVHPIYSHAQLWQLLQLMNGQNVEVKHLEFRRGSWTLQIQAQNPSLAESWIDQFAQRLNSAVKESPTPSSNSLWRVLTHASRSHDGLTLVDLEIQR